MTKFPLTLVVAYCSPWSGFICITAVGQDVDTLEQMMISNFPISQYKVQSGDVLLMCPLANFLLGSYKDWLLRASASEKCD